MHRLDRGAAGVAPGQVLVEPRELERVGSLPSSRMAMSGSAFSHSGDEVAIETSASPRSSSRSLIRAREISCATELRFMSMISAISS